MLPGVVGGRRTTALLLSALGLIALALPCLGVPGQGTDQITDVVVGRNNKGPYQLTWTDIDAKSVRVVLNGRTLRNGENYSVDAAKGLVSFTSVLLNDVIVHVSYDVTPKSQKAAGKLNVPVTLNIFERQDASIQVTGIYAQDDPRNPDAGKTVVGLGTEKKWAQTKVGSQFFISQRNDKDNGQAGSSWDRSAFRIGTETDTGRVKFTGSMVHAGSEFTGGKETGLGSGKDTRDLALTVDPNKFVQFNASMQQTENTAGNAKGNEATALKQSLVVKPSDATNITVSHVTTENSTASGSKTAVEASAATASASMGGNTKATVSFEDKTIDTGDKSDNIKTTQANVSTAPVKQVNLNVGVTNKESELLGQEKQYNVGATLKPVEQVAVTAAHTVTETSSAEKTKTDLTIKATPLKNTELTGNVAVRTENDTENFQRDFRITSRPVQFAKVTAAMSQKGINENDDVTKSAALELSPFANTRITAGYIYTEAGSRVMTIRDYGASSKLGGFFTVSGSMRDRQVATDDAPDTKQMQVAVAPMKDVTLTGTYQANPEDQKGQIQTYKATNVGLRVKFGSVGITTDYSSKDEYMVARMSDERRVGFDVPMFRHGKLTTGVKIARLLDGSENSTRTYSLGYTHNLGSTFNLALTGYYTSYMQNQVASPDKTEYSAEASVGLKF